MNIAAGVEMLDIPAEIRGTPTLIHPTLIWDDQTTILVDAGFPGQVPEFRRAIIEAGVYLERIDKIIITHHDRDHTGSLRTLLTELPQKVSVLAHEKEKAYIEGRIPPFKATLANAPESPYPPEMKTAFLTQMFDYPDFAVSVDKTLEDGEELPFCGGITIIHTPGHTPGHICLYLLQSKTLIAGDALLVEGGKLGLLPEFASFDWRLALRSLDKLAGFDIDTVVCYHGGIWMGNIKRSIAELSDF